MDPSSRRPFLSKAALGTLSMTAMTEAQPSGTGSTSHALEPTEYGIERCITEWAFHSPRAYADPFNDVELDAIFTDPQGKEQRVPTFWAGENVWRVLASPALAVQPAQAECSPSLSDDRRWSARMNGCPSTILGPR